MKIEDDKLVVGIENDDIHAMQDLRLATGMNVELKKIDADLIKIKMDEYEAGAKLIKQNPNQFVIALLYNFIQRIAFFSISFFVYISFFKSYPEIKGFSYFDLVAIQVLVALCVDSLPLPGGVGISEYLYIILLGTVYQRNGVDILGSAMILTRVFNFYIPLIVTGIIVVIKQILELRKIGKRS